MKNKKFTMDATISRKTRLSEFCIFCSACTWFAQASKFLTVSQFWREQAQCSSSTMIWVWFWPRYTCFCHSSVKSDASWISLSVRLVLTSSSSSSCSTTTGKCLSVGQETDTTPSRSLVLQQNAWTNSFSVYWSPQDLCSCSLVHFTFSVQLVSWSTTTKYFKELSTWTSKLIKQ